MKPFSQTSILYYVYVLSSSDWRKYTCKSSNTSQESYLINRMPARSEWDDQHNIRCIQARVRIRSRRCRLWVALSSNLQHCSEKEMKWREKRGILDSSAFLANMYTNGHDRQSASSARQHTYAHTCAYFRPSIHLPRGVYWSPCHPTTKTTTPSNAFLFNQS